MSSSGREMPNKPYLIKCAECPDYEACRRVLHCHVKDMPILEVSDEAVAKLKKIQQRLLN